ncbi:MAG: YicC family protein [Bacteroidetes bacterium]|nr:YicC family protein [Bacteroidota bacterium]
MIKSMTGFGVAGFENDQMVVHVEVRSLNSKFLDLTVRSPRQFSDREPEIRNLVQSSLERGKVSVTIDFVPKGPQQLPVQLNEDLFRSYFTQFQQLATSVNESSEELFKLALQAPNVMVHVPADREESQDWDQVKRVVEQALAQCDRFRSDEGASLWLKMKENCAIISQGLQRIKEDDPARKEKIKQRIKGYFSQWVEENSFDANRFEQELIYYFEKIDITEELVRLQTHLDYFLSSMENELLQGKKLGFIAQEIGREINTIGSKANDAGIQRQVILMKDELEKIKEQSLNVL